MCCHTVHIILLNVIAKKIKYEQGPESQFINCCANYHMTYLIKSPDSLVENKYNFFVTKMWCSRWEGKERGGLV